MSSKYKLLSHYPEGKNDFTSNGHENVAKTIEEIIINHSEVDRQLIGLEGDWGSGKSNIIKMVEKNLCDTHLVLLYDFWSNQEQISPYSFMSFVVDQIENKRGCECKNLRKEVSNSLSSIRVQEESVTPKHGWGIFIGVLGWYTTLLASTFFKQQYPQNWEIILIVVNIVAVVAFIGLYYLIVRRFPWDVIQEALSLKASSTLSEIKSFETGPSLSGIRKFLHKAQQVVRKKLKKEIIVVFDNIDRVSTEYVPSTLSMINTFFSESDKNGLWGIVPFSHQHFKAHFSGNLESSEKILSKMIPIVISVPKPLVTDWKNFLFQKIEDSNLTKSQTEQNHIAEIYELGSNHITPRYIIDFVNHLVLTSSQFPDIPILDRAVFSSIRNVISGEEDMLKYIVNASFIKVLPDFARGDLDRLKSNLAEMVFGLSQSQKANAMMVYTIASQIRSGMKLVKSDLPKEYLDWVLQFSKDWFEYFNIKNDDFVPFVEMLENLYGAQIPQLNSVWHQCITRALTEKSSDQKLIPSHEIILSKVEWSDYLGRLIRQIFTDITGVNNFKVVPYLKVIKQVLDLRPNDKKAINKLLPETLISGSEYLNGMKYFKGLINEFNIKCINPSEISDELIKRIFRETEFDAYIADLGSLYDLSKFKSHICEALTGQGKLHKETCNRYLKFARELDVEYESSSTLNLTLVRRILDQIKSQQPAVPGNKISDMLALLLVKQPEHKPPIMLQIEKDIKRLKSTAKTVSEIIEYYGDLGHLIKFTLTPSMSNPLLNQIVIDIIERKDYERSKLDIAGAFKEFDKIVKATGVDPKKLLEFLCDYPGEIKEEDLNFDVIGQNKVLKKTIEEYSKKGMLLNLIKNKML